MQRHRLRSFPSLRGTVLAAALWAGSCAGPAAPRAEEEVGRAAGLDPIEFRVEGMPLDMEPHGAERLALPDAVRLAVERDAELQAALARVRAALADAEQARLLPNPLLTLVVRWPEGGGRTSRRASPRTWPRCSSARAPSTRRTSASPPRCTTP